MSTSKQLAEEPVAYETSEDVDVTPSFDSLGLREDLLRGIYAYGLSASTTVPQAAWCNGACPCRV
jgi:hypothetical protein